MNGGDCLTVTGVDGEECSESDDSNANESWDSSGAADDTTSTTGTAPRRRAAATDITLETQDRDGAADLGQQVLRSGVAEEKHVDLSNPGENCPESSDVGL